MGDDDVLSPNFVAEFFKHEDQIEQNGIDVVRYATQVIDEHNEKRSKIHTHPPIENAINFLFRKFSGGSRSSLSEFIFRKKDVQKIEFKQFPLAWHSDDLAILEFSKWKNIYTINESVVFFRNSGINITSSSSNMREKNKASFLFYFYLLKRHHNVFTKNQIEILTHRLEQTLLNDKRQFNFLNKYIGLKLRNKDWKFFFGFFRRWIKSVATRTSRV